MNCEYCAAESGTYDLTQRCCRARFTALSGYSRKRARQWCDYWRRMFPAEEAEATIEMARRLWKSRSTSRLSRRL